MNTKSSQGYDKIPQTILKMCANEILKPLSTIIYMSLNLGTFVDTAKISVSLYKNPKTGNRQQISQY